MTDRPPSGGRRKFTLDGLVDETPVWLEINERPAVTWMCTPEKLEELVLGWLHGEGYIDSREDLLKLRPCATDLGFWATIPADRLERVRTGNRRPVLASGCGSVTAFLGDPDAADLQPARGHPPEAAVLRSLFKELFARGERYHDTGGIHSAALVLSDHPGYHAEDIGRHNAVDKVIGAALLEGLTPAGAGLLVTGRISAELAHKAVRAGIAWVATPSVPSTLAWSIARRAGVVLVGRAVSGRPQVHLPDPEQA